MDLHSFFGGILLLDFYFPSASRIQSNRPLWHNNQFYQINLISAGILTLVHEKARPSASLASLRSISTRTWYQFLMVCDNHVMIVFEEVNSDRCEITPSANFGVRAKF